MKQLSLFIMLVAVVTTYTHAQPVWTQKAGFSGTGNAEFRAFAINDNVYIVGPSPNLWQYNTLTDTWTQMAALTGSQRNSPVAFAIGTKGYFGTGGSFNDFYEYDEPTNTWTTKANFGGTGREGASRRCPADGSRGR